jgi:hypothetical protein
MFKNLFKLPPVKTNVAKTCVLAVMLLFGFSTTAYSATYYIAATGGSDSNPGTSAARWATFNHAWTGMAPGDTLIVGNGTYTQMVSPPSSLSGSSGAYTTVQAENTWGATVDGSTVTPAYKATLYMYGMHYFQVIGIKFASGPSLTDSQNPITIDTSDHIKLLKLAGYNAPCNNNTAVFVITNTSYALVEDSHAWGCGRYKFLAYQSQNIIFRHNVARHDSAEVSGGVIGTWGRQCAQFTMYDSTNILWQNDISVDSGELDASTGNLYGGIWSENNASVDNSGKYEGDIFINLKTGTDPSIMNGASINDQKLIGTREISNVAIINSIAGIWTNRLDTTVNPANLLIHHITAVNLTGGSPNTGNSADGVGAVELSNTNFTQELAEDSIFQQDNSYGLAGYLNSDYNIFYSNTANFGTSASPATPTAGAHDRLSTNPLLLYPVRVEAGSPAKGTASDGGDVGATILYRIGTPGTLLGDTGYDTLTTIPLWPWTDEAVIKSDMASYTGQGDPGVRGFTAPGNGLYGGPITLTSYIWESLGNACPADVCTTSTGTTTTATAPTFSPVSGPYSSTQDVALSTGLGTVICYNTTGGPATNGATGCTSGTLYTAPIAVASTETLYAVAGGSGYTDSPVSSATYNITSTATKPTFSPAGGTYSSTQSVSISTSLGSVICYSTTGSPATDGASCTSGTKYTSPVTVSSSETLYAVAGASGYTDSPVSSATYNITTLVAATPTFSPVAGTYSSTQTVSIADTTTGAVVYYTTDGSTPTMSSAVYSGPITVSSTETLKAIAVATGYSNSAVATAVYTISVGQAATAIFSPAGGTYTSAQTVAIGTTTPSAIIYYTTNGATPTTSSAVYSGPISVSATETLKAIAVATGYSNSAVATAAFTINLAAAATPTFSPVAGTYTSVQTVTISTTTPSAIIYYTTNGATPTTSSALYSGPISVSATETLQAIATASGFSSSAVATAAYTINLAQAATPIFSPGAGTYTSAQRATISSATPSSTIYYTTNGTTPTTSSAVYAGPITVSATETIEAIAVASGYSNSGVATAAYTISLAQTATPIFSPGTGTYTSTQTVTIGSATPLSTIYYTTNGTTPTTSSAVYSGPITVASTETLSAIATASGYSTSAVATAAYTLSLALSVAATPTFSPGAGTYTSAQTVTISSATPSATIYYTTNGSTPTTSSAVYSGPIGVSSTETLEAMATAGGYTSSGVGAAAYTINLIQPAAASPTFSPVAGTYSSSQTVTISSTTPSATIYYTTNGSAPTTGSAVYSGPITVSSTETLEAIATASGFTTSTVASAAYTINAPASDFAVLASPTSLTINAGQTATVMVSVTPLNGFNAPVSLNCAGLPVGVSCIFSPPTVAPAGAPASTALTVSTTTTTAALHQDSRPLFPGSVLAVALCFFGWKKRRGLQMLLLLVVSVAGLCLLNGCGGATFAATASRAAVTSTVTVTGASGSLMHTTTFSVTVK